MSVTGVVDFSLSIEPTESKAYRATTHRVLIENTGNAPISAQLSATEASGELNLELADERLDVAADTTAETTLTINVLRPNRIGRAVERPFEVVAADQRCVQPSRQREVVTTTPSVPISLVATCAAVLGLGMVAVVVATTALDDDDAPSPPSTEPAPETTSPPFVPPDFPFSTFVFPIDVFPELEQRLPDFVLVTTTTGP